MSRGLLGVRKVSLLDTLLDQAKSFQVFFPPARLFFEHALQGLRTKVSPELWYGTVTLRPSLC